MATDLTNAKPADLLRLRNIIVQDPVALDRWGRIVEHVITSPADERRIKSLLKNHEYDEAVLQTLRLCEGDLLRTLREQGLNSLVAKIMTNAPVGCSSTAGVWFGMEELPHDFVGRQADLERIHVLLVDSHSNESVMSNVVAITGPRLIGKSTLARKYAFRHWQFYDGNVLWMNAESIESLEMSFKRLAAELGLHIPEDSSTLELLVADVYRHFNTKRCLFVFDNLHTLLHFHQVKPSIGNPSNATPYLLVTSENDLLPIQRNNFRLNGLNLEDAAALIQPGIEDVAVAMVLGELTCRHPFAIKEAVKLMGDVDFASDQLTWTKVLREIKVGQGETIRDLLLLVACLHPESINVLHLKSMLHNTDKLSYTLDLLQVHSFVSVDEEENLKLKPAMLRVMEGVKTGLQYFPKKWIINHLQSITKQLAESLAVKKFTPLTRKCCTHGTHLLKWQAEFCSESLEGMGIYLSDLCYYLLQYGELQQALEVAQLSATVFDGMRGPSDNSTIRMNFRAAEARCHMRHYSEASKIIESLEPCEMMRWSKLEDSRLSLAIAVLKAEIKFNISDHGHAWEILSQVIPKAVHLFGEDDRDVLCYRQFKAVVQLAKKELEKGMKLLQEVYAKQRQKYGLMDIETVHTIHWMASGHRMMGDFNEALKLWRIAYESYTQMLGAQSESTAVVGRRIEDMETKLANKEPMI